MAWTDSCKFEACAQIDKRKDTAGGIRPAIRELSEESGIPAGTLREWYYPRECRKTPTPCENITYEPPWSTYEEMLECFQGIWRKALAGDYDAWLHDFIVTILAFKDELWADAMRLFNKGYSIDHYIGFLKSIPMMAFCERRLMQINEPEEMYFYKNYLLKQTQVAGERLLDWESLLGAELEGGNNHERPGIKEGWLDKEGLGQKGENK